MGRKSTFNAKDAEEIVSRLSKGEPLAAICRDDWLPAYRTVYDWMNADESFAANIARAREEGFDALASQCLAISDTTCVGVETTTKPDGSVETREGDMLGHRKLQIDTRLKLLAKWDPKRYGDKIQQEVNGSLTVEIVRFGQA
jgi:hypothetical protein